MVIDFEHHYIPAELGRRLGMDPTRKEAVRTRDATVHSQLFDMDAQIRDMDRVGIDVAISARGAAVAAVMHQIEGGKANLLAVLEEAGFVHFSPDEEGERPIEPSADRQQVQPSA